MEVSKNITFSQLVARVAEHLQLRAVSLQLFKDQDYKQKLLAGGSTALSKCGISDGMMLYVSDDKAKLAIAPKSEGNLDRYPIVKTEAKKEVAKDTKSKKCNFL